MMITQEKLIQLLNSAYLAGFMASGEGYNGEFPFDDFDLPIDNKAWMKDRENCVNSLVENIKGVL